MRTRAVNSILQERTQLRFVDPEMVYFCIQNFVHAGLKQNITMYRIDVLFPLTHSNCFVYVLRF